MSRRALVTGSTGQDGSYLVEALLSSGYDVHVFVRHHEENDPRVTHPVKQHIGDLSDLESIRRAVNASEPEVIFNLGGLSSVAASWECPTTAGVITGAACTELLESAWRLQERSGREVKFVQASSGEIFGISHNNPQTEQSPLSPINPYGAAKAYAHQMVEIYRTRGLAASSAILFNHESPRRPVQFVTRKISVGVAKIALGLADSLALGSLEVKRDWGWAPDYVDAMCRMAKADHADDYVIATGKSHSLREFVEAAFRSVGILDWQHHVRIDQKLIRPNDTPEMRGDPTKALLSLGWEPTTTFDEIAKRMVQHDLRGLSAEASAERTGGIAWQA